MRNKTDVKKVNYEVKELSKQIAVEFVKKHHYSPVMPSITKHYLGFFLDSALVGVLTLGWGTRPRDTFKKMFSGFKDEVNKKNDKGEYVHHISNYYFEIGKMCMTDDMPKNSESQMMSSTIRWLKNNYPKCSFLYTMADGIMGKCGYVYQASNFRYGDKYFTDVYLMENGEKLHPRTSKELCKENALFLKEKNDGRYDKLKTKEQVFWLTSDFMQMKGIKRISGYMFRYIYPLNKTAKKYLKTKSDYDWDQSYPKDDILKWKDITDKKNSKEIPMPKFNLEIGNMKYNNKRRTIEDFFKKIP
jgi:hypothetical protein